jgi:ribosomal protein S12 methylthiotransferase accessory factor
MMHRLVLGDAFKTFTRDQDKVIPPEETVRRFHARLKAVRLNLLEDTVRIDNGRLGIPVYLSRCGSDAQRVTGTRKQMGKGATPQQAEASAVMELAERFSLFSFIQHPPHFAHCALAALCEPTIPFELIARSVHDASEDLPKIRPIFERLPFNWTWAFNLTQGHAVMIPFDWFFAINEFNGSSAGNCKEEAILQGICETVERHVSSIISHKQRRVPAIRPESAQDPLVVEMLAKYRRCGIRLFISDFTLNTGIPTVGVLAYDPQTHPQRSEIVWTAGTTPSPEKALSRALTEVAQLAGDFNTGATYVASGLPKFKTLEAADYVTDPGHEVNLASLPDLSHANIRIEIENCVQALARRELDVFLVETSHPDLRIPAYYTIIPGAHFRERSRNTSVLMFTAKHAAETMDPVDAIPALEEMGRAWPEKYFLQFYLGLARLKASEPDLALSYFRRALELDPDPNETPSIYSYMGLAAKDSGRFDEALEFLRKGAEIDPDRTDLHNLMGYCHFKRGEHEEAVAAFQRVIELDPGSAIDYANLGVNYQALGQTAKARDYYEVALRLDPQIDFARERLSQMND